MRCDSIWERMCLDEIMVTHVSKPITVGDLDHMAKLVDGYTMRSQPICSPLYGNMPLESWRDRPHIICLPEGII